MIRIFDPLFKLAGVKPHLEEEYAEKRERVTLKKHILHDMEIIDSKSSALLTHVSLMIAVLIVLITNITMESALIYTILNS